MKKCFIKVQLYYDDEPQAYYISRPKEIDVESLFDGIESERAQAYMYDSYKLSVVEMTEEEYVSLPEFDGF